jgi:hypothetical protein
MIFKDTQFYTQHIQDYDKIKFVVIPNASEELCAKGASAFGGK